MTIPPEASLQNNLTSTLSVLGSTSAGFAAGLVTWADEYLKILGDAGAIARWLQENAFGGSSQVWRTPGFTACRLR